MLKNYLNVDIALVIIVIASLILILKKGSMAGTASSSREQKSISKSQPKSPKVGSKKFETNFVSSMQPRIINSKPIDQRPSVVSNPKVELQFENNGKRIEPEDALVELDYASQDDFKYLFSAVEVERDFLLNQVGLSTEHYNEIVEHRLKVRDHLRNAEMTARATGTPTAILTKPILAQHVYWMENSIGVGNYNLLQEILSR